MTFNNQITMYLDEEQQEHKPTFSLANEATTVPFS